MTYLIVAGFLAFLSSSAIAQNAADEFYSPKAMAKSRAALSASHGGQNSSLILGERFEVQSNDGDPLTVWEAQAWFGGDLQKLWIKTEGEYKTDEGRLEEAEIQALYSRALSPFWDIQAGFRYDLKPDPSRSYAVIGVQGLAPFWFELDGQLFLSNKGDSSVRLEAEYELRLTQRWKLQPRLELNASFSEDKQIGIGSGLSSAEAGLRLRYEITREFAPYFGVSWNRSFGETKELRALAGNDDQQFSWVAGIRFWY